MLYQRQNKGLFDRYESMNQFIFLPLYNALSEQSNTLYKLGLSAKKSNISKFVKQYLVENPSPSFYKVRESLIEQYRSNLIYQLTNLDHLDSIYKIARMALLLECEEEVFQL